VIIAGGSDSTSNAEVKLPQKLVHAAVPLMYGKATAGDVLGMLRKLAPCPRCFRARPASPSAPLAS
jgi:acetyl-CoA acyltransferase